MQHLLLRLLLLLLVQDLLQLLVSRALLRGHGRRFLLRQTQTAHKEVGRQTHPERLDHRARSVRDTAAHAEPSVNHTLETTLDVRDRDRLEFGAVLPCNQRLEAVRHRIRLVEHIVQVIHGWIAEGEGVGRVDLGHVAKGDRRIVAIKHLPRRNLVPSQEQDHAQGRTDRKEILDGEEQVLWLLVIVFLEHGQRVGFFRYLQRLGAEDIERQERAQGMSDERHLALLFEEIRVALHKQSIDAVDFLGDDLGHLIAVFLRQVEWHYKACELP